MSSTLFDENPIPDSIAEASGINMIEQHTNADASDAAPEEMYEDDCQHIFPQRLMNVLMNEKNHDAICWLPHGRAFVIRNRKIFAEKIMPRFFPRKSKYSSFTRKLNRWNFVRVSSGPEIGAYYHEFFLRDKPHLAAQMFCKNARTMIAMATDHPKPVALPLASMPPKAQVVPFQQPRPMQQQQPLQAQSMPGLSVKEVDAATELYLRNQQLQQQQQQQLDPAMQYLLNQQLNFCQPKPIPPVQPQQQVRTMAPAPMQQPPQVNPRSFFRSQQQQLQEQQQAPSSQFSFQNPSPMIPEPTPFLAYGDGTQLGMNMNECINSSVFNHGMCNNSNFNQNTNNNANGDLNLWQQIQAQKQQEAQMMQLRQLMALNLQRQQQRKSGAKNVRASAA